MNNTTRYINLKTVLIFLTFLSITSCSKDDDLNNLEETIFVRHKNADMPAYIYGNGCEKVFLITLHGGPGGWGLNLRTSAFKNVIEKKYAVVYFDQRGSGMSQGSYSDNGISLDIMAEDVLALVKTMKHKYGEDSRFFLLGLSWGGTLGIATVLKDQNEFLGWIEVDGGPNPKGQYQEYRTNLERVADAQIELGNSVVFWESVYGLLGDVDNTFNRNDYRRMNIKSGQGERILFNDNILNKPVNDNNHQLDYNITTTLSNFRTINSILFNQGIWENLSFTNRLPEIKIPSLVLWGKHDMIVPATFAQEAYDNLGSDIKKLVIFERSGHTPMFSEANKFSEEVIQFMDQNK